MDKSFFIGSIGTFVGFSAGAVDNLLSNGGSPLARKSLDNCISLSILGSEKFSLINTVRESFPLVSLMHFVSDIMAHINTYYDRTEEEYGVFGYLKTYWNRHYKKVLLNTFHHSVSFGIGMIAREYLKEFVPAEIDISGHAMSQVFFNFETIQLLRDSEEKNKPWQKTALKTLALGIGITDAVWMFNTTSNCHSVADVIAGFAISLAADRTTSGLKWCFSKVGNKIYMIGSSVFGKQKKEPDTSTDFKKYFHLL